MSHEDPLITYTRDKFAKRSNSYYEREIDRLREQNAALLAGCQHALLLLEGLSTDGEITMTPEGKDRITAQLRAAIKGAKP